MNNLTKTENNATTLASSLSPVLDLFYLIGGQTRNADIEPIFNTFMTAYRRDPERTLAVLFWARAARIGAGARRIPLSILERVNEACPDFLANNAATLADLGYYKDLKFFADNPGVIKSWATQVRAKDRLACKWAPRTGDIAKRMKDELGMTWKQWRTHLKENSETVEQKMCNKQFNGIEYPSVPNVAARKYRVAFKRNDGERYGKWLDDKTAKASASSAYPVDCFILARKSDEDGRKLGNKQWDNLPDFVKEGESFLPIVDTSGSMDHKVNGEQEDSFSNDDDTDKMRAIDVAVSLGLYLSERNKGQFKDSIMTFSQHPMLVKLDPGTLYERYSDLKSKTSERGTGWGYNTDFGKTYECILDTAKSFNVPQEHMPSMLLCISDMEFDKANGRYDRDDEGEEVTKTHLDNLRDKYQAAGYKMPKLVFWNVCARQNHVPARFDDPEVGLVSGYSPSVMTALLECEDFSPYTIMLEALKPIELNFDRIPRAEDF